MIIQPWKAISITAVLVAGLVAATPASASTTLSFDFNSANALSNNFNNYVSSGPVAWSSTGGISDSG